MLTTGSHVFIFFYIFAFLLGVASVTANWILFSRSGEEVYRRLHWFHICYSAHIAINFAYFYRNYFIAFWEWRILILTLVNTSFLLMVYFGTNVLAGFGRRGPDRRSVLLPASGAFYVIAYSLIRWYHLGVDSVFHGIPSTIAFIGSNALFTGISLYYILSYFKNSRGADETKESKESKGGDETKNKESPIRAILTLALFAALLFNIFIDTYYGMLSDRIMVMNVSGYHLSVLIYLTTNITLLLRLYREQLRHLQALSPEQPGHPQAASDSTEEAAPENHAPQIRQLAEARQLTQREQELIRLVLEGRSNPDIAERLCISENTVKHHLSNIYRKLEISSRFELIQLIHSRRPGNIVPKSKQK